MQLPRKLSDWMGKRCSGGLLVLGLLLFASSPVAAQGRHAEGKILWDLRHSFTDPGGSRLQGWESALADPCSGWTGVTCDSDGYVVSLDLKEQGLQGMLPASLGQLSRLQSLSLFGSELAQALPDNWAAADSFPALAALELTHAAEEWELPQSWSREGAFPALRELRLEGIAVAGISAAVEETGRQGDRRPMGSRRRLAQSSVVTASNADDSLPASQRSAFSSVAPAPAPESISLLAGTPPEATPAAVVPSTSTPFSTTAAPTTTVAPTTATAQAPVTASVTTTGAPATASPTPTPSAPPATVATPSPAATTAPPTTSQSLTSTPAPTTTAPASSTPIPSSVAPSTAAPSTTSQPPSSTSTPAPPVTSAVPPSTETSTPVAAAPTAATGSASTPAPTPAATTAAPSRTNSTSPSPNLIITSSPTVSPTAQPTSTATLRAPPPVTSAPTSSPEQSPTPTPTTTPAPTTTGVAAVAPALGSTAVPTTLAPQPAAPAPQAVTAATPAPTTSTAAPTTTSAPPQTTPAPVTNAPQPAPPSTLPVPSTTAAAGAPPVAAPAAVESSRNVSAGVPTTSVPAPPPSPLILPAGRTAQAPAGSNISVLAGQGSAPSPATVSATGAAGPAAAPLGTNSSRSAAPSPGAGLQTQNTSQNASAPAPVPSSAAVSSQRPLAPEPSLLESPAQPPTILPVVGTATSPISGPSGLPHPSGLAVAPAQASAAASPTTLPIPSLGRAPGPSVALGPSRLAAGAGAPIPSAALLAGLARVPSNAPAPRTPALLQDGPAPAPTSSGSGRAPAQQPAGLEAHAPAPGLQALAPAPSPGNGSRNASSAPVPAPGAAATAVGSTATAPSPVAEEAAGLGGQGPAPQPGSSSGRQEAAGPAPGAAAVAAGAVAIGNGTTPEAASPSNPELPTNQSASGPALAPTAAGVISIASLPGSDGNTTNVTATKQYLAPSDIPANVSDSTLSTAIVSTDVTSNQTFNNLDDLETPLLNALNAIITQAGYTAYLAVPNVTFANGTQSFNLSELAPGAAPAPLPENVNVSVSVVNNTSAGAPASTHNATDANGILVDTSSRRRSLLQGRSLLQSSTGTHLQINITITAQNDSTAAISQLVQQALASGTVQSALQASGLSANFSNVLVTVIAPGVPTNTAPASQLVGSQVKSSGAGVSIGAIVGAAVGAFVLAVLAILVGWRVKRHRHNRKVWKRDLETARGKPAGSLEGSSDSNSSGGVAGKKPLAMSYVPFGVGSNDSVDATPHAKHATGLDAFAGQRRQRAEVKAGRSGRSTGHPLTDSAGGNNNMGTNMSGLMGTGFSDAMTTEGSGNTPKHSSASDRPYGYGHPKYDPHLAQRNPLTRGISNEHLLKGQSDELSDATALGGASSGPLPSNSSALVPSRQASGAVDANKWAVNWGDLEVQKQIGEGSFGRVYLAKWRETTVAVKVLSSTGASSSMEEEQEAIIDNAHLLEGLAKEAGMMASMRHPNVVMYLGLCMDPPCVVTEYCARGSLNDVLKRARQMPALASQLDWARRLNMVLDAAKGMMYLHSSEPPVIHRDLKSPNLLVDKHWRVKVCDFNLSRVMEETVVLSSMAASNPRWLAPEILGGKGYSFSSDVYSFGMIMWEFLTWQVPWHDCGPWQVVALVTEGQQRPELPSKEDMPGDSRSFAGLDEYIRLMNRCWHQVPESRPTFAETITVLRRLLAAEMRTRSGQMTKQVSLGSDEVKPALE